MKKRWHKRHITEAIVKFFMKISFGIVAGSLALILWTIISRGLPALSWEMISQPPQSGYYLGGGGGILNAILGSLYMAGGGTLLAWQSNGTTLLLTGAAKYSPDDQPYSLELQTSFGVNQPSGFGWGGANIALSISLEELGLVSAYVNYEIWRLDVLPFRTGVNLELNVGPGALVVQGYGGADLNWRFGGGGRIAYRLDLGSLFNP